MVKGVNKTVIEVNDTGSKLFEKIVFYVTPQYGTLSAKQLQRAAREFSFSFSEATVSKKSVRQVCARKKKIRLSLIIGGAVLIFAVGLFIFL